MSIKKLTEDRLDKLQEMMEENDHLTNKKQVEDLVENIAKCWTVLDEADREYIQCVRVALEQNSEWNV